MLATTGSRTPRPSSLSEILDKGMVIDAFVRDRDDHREYSSHDRDEEGED